MVRGLGLRLFIAAAIVLTLVSVALVTLGIQVNTLRSETHAGHHSEQVLIAATTLDELQGEMVAAVNAYFLSRNPAALTAWRQARETEPTVAQFLISQVAGTANEPQGKALVAGLNTFVASVLDPILRVASKDPVAARALAVRLQAVPRAAALRVQFEAFLTAATMDANDQLNKADHTASLIIGLFGIRIGGSALVIIGIMLFLHWRIVVPIRRVSTAA